MLLWFGSPLNNSKKYIFVKIHVKAPSTFCCTFSVLVQCQNSPRGKQTDRFLPDYQHQFQTASFLPPVVSYLHFETPSRTKQTARSQDKIKTGITVIIITLQTSSKVTCFLLWMFWQPCVLLPSQKCCTASWECCFFIFISGTSPKKTRFG